MVRFQIKQADWARLHAIVTKALQSVVSESAEAEVLRMLHTKLDAAQIVEELQPEVVGLGVKIGIRESKGGEQLEFAIVTPEEADWMEGRLSVLAPLAATFLGRRQGERVLVRAPNGSTHWTIESVGNESPVYSQT